jgi:hypothetical protein
LIPISNETPCPTRLVVSVTNVVDVEEVLSCTAVLREEAVCRGLIPTLNLSKLSFVSHNSVAPKYAHKGSAKIHAAAHNRAPSFALSGTGISLSCKIGLQKLRAIT